MIALASMLLAFLAIKTDELRPKFFDLFLKKTHWRELISQHKRVILCLNIVQFLLMLSVCSLTFMGSHQYA